MECLQMNMDSIVGTLACSADLLVHLNPAHNQLYVLQVNEFATTKNKILR